MAKAIQKQETPALNEKIGLDRTKFDILVEAGIPVSVAVFQRAVQSFGGNGLAGEPETAYYDITSKSKPSRTAEMYYTPHGLLCRQKYADSIVPLANVAFARFK